MGEFFALLNYNLSLNTLQKVLVCIGYFLRENYRKLTDEIEYKERMLKFRDIWVDSKKIQRKEKMVI